MSQAYLSLQRQRISSDQKRFESQKKAMDKQQPNTNISLNNLSEIYYEQTARDQSPLEKQSNFEHSQQYNVTQQTQIIIPNVISSNEQVKQRQFQPITVNAFSMETQYKPKQTGQEQQRHFIDDPEEQDNKVSLSLQKIQAHSLIRFILDKNKKKVIQHKINIVDPGSILYRKLKQKDQKQPRIIINNPSKDEVENGCGKKLNQVYKKIKDQFRSLNQPRKDSQDYESSKSLHSFSNNKKQNSLDQARVQNMQHFSLSQRDLKNQGNRKIVAVSGLASYKFKSLKAQKNLVYNPLRNSSDEQVLQNKLQSIKLKAKCPIYRLNKIQCRSVSGKEARQIKQKQIALRQSVNKLQYTKISTEGYLRKIQMQKNNISRIYGQQKSKLDYINYLMNHQNLNRPLAEYSVDQIMHKIKTEAKQKSNSGFRHRTVYPEQKLSYVDDEVILNQRKKTFYKPKRTRQLCQGGRSSNTAKDSSKIILNHLTFVNEYD